MMISHVMQQTDPLPDWERLPGRRGKGIRDRVSGCPWFLKADLARMALVCPSVVLYHCRCRFVVPSMSQSVNTADRGVFPWRFLQQTRSTGCWMPRCPSWRWLVW